MKRQKRLFLLCMVVAIVASLGLPVYANRMLSVAFDVSNMGGIRMDVAYSSADSIYLAVWENDGIWGHFIDDDGGIVPGSSDFRISDPTALGLCPSVTYNATDNEFLVTWDDQGAGPGRSGANQIYGQRIKSLTGQRLGRGANPSPVNDFQITTQGSCWRSASAWSSTSNVYYVVSLKSGTGVFGQLLNNKAEVLSNITVSNGYYPAVSYGLEGDQFLVAWDGTGVGVQGKRIRADGTVIDASPFLVTVHPGDRPNIAYDSNLNRWCVQHSYFVPPVPPDQWARPTDQYGQFISTSPTGNPLIGEQFPIANTTAFEGETNYGTDICYLPNARLFMSSYIYSGATAEIAGQLVDEEGFRKGPRQIFDYYDGVALRFFRNAADTNRNRFITVWNAPGHVKGRIFAIESPSPVTGLTASGDGGQNTLRWTNPTDADFDNVMIRYSTAGYPATINDGILVGNKVGDPGQSDVYVHSGLANGTTYYYSVFARNIFDEYSTKVTASATPNAANILNPSSAPSSFSSTFHGWTLTNWGNDADPGKWGTIAWGGGVGKTTGGIRCKGYGDTDDNNRDLREGGDMKRVISTAGYTNIKFSYDLRVGTLGNALSGTGFGSASVLNNDIQDQLIVYYSKTGINGPWLQADWVGHNNLLSYITYGTRSVDLSAIAGVADNPNFALKFIWQFNSKLEAGDCGDLDNVKLFGDLITDPVPPTATVSAPSVLSTSTGPIAYTVNFSESVTGFATSGDVIVNKTGTATAGSVTISGSGAGPYTVTLSNITGSGTIGMTVKAGACSDIAGNSNTASSPSAKTLVISTDGSIADAKSASENSAVTLGNKVLYYKNGTVGYIEESDRFAGMRIEGSIPQSEGEKVSLSGAVKTNASGERYILLDVMLPAGSESVGALGTNNRAAKLAVMDGLLTTVWGLVIPDSITSNSFVISDGSDSEGIKIITVGSPGVTENTFEIATGAAGKEDGKRVIYKK